MSYNYYYAPNHWWVSPNTGKRRIVIPKLPAPEEVEYECGECGMVFGTNDVMGCGNIRCPVYPKVILS